MCVIVVIIIYLLITDQFSTKLQKIVTEMESDVALLCPIYYYTA